MHYRDDTGAAVARLTALEVELAERRCHDEELRRQRAALEDEMAELEHAFAWYARGERAGWVAAWPGSRAEGAAPSPRVGGPSTAGGTTVEAWLAAATIPALAEWALRPLRPPGATQLAHAYGALDPTLLHARLADVEMRLARSDGRSSRLRVSVETLREQADVLRRAVEELARRYPDHPPPARVDASHALVLGLAAGLGGLWVAAMLLALLAG